MIKIILICNHFAPDNAIAAIRTTKLAKYFVQEGCEVKVLAERKYNSLSDNILKEDAQGIQCTRIDNSTRCKKVVAWYRKMIAPIKNKRLERLDNRVRVNPKTGYKEFYTYETAYPFLGSLDYLVERYRQHDLFAQSKKILMKEKDYDLILTSYGDMFSVYAGFFLKKQRPEIPWVCDIRDAIYRYKFTPKYVEWLADRTEKQVARRADYIVAVSNGIKERMDIICENKTVCITNGFDWSDRSVCKAKNHANSKLTFVYTGSMYGGLQDLSPFFRSVSELVSNGVINKDFILIQYAGNKSAFDIFAAQAAKYGIDECCEYQGKIPRKDALQLQTMADVLLVASFDYKSASGGVITGKALEYMSALRPMIAIINGDIEHSELKKIIERCNLGIAYEQSQGDKDYSRLRNYIEEIYKQFILNRQVPYTGDLEKIDKFNYTYLGFRYLSMIRKLVS